ncbi:signal peptidase II, partial [Desulfovibrio sp. OttesenSCG-928-G15]|nr:signal peptidase II [Desulfovibrio sp. OttesenSCG-928-G15]
FTKYLVDTTMAMYDVIEITPFFNLVHVLNHGAAFGFLNDPETTWQFWFFLAATLMALGIIVFIAKSAPRSSTVLFAGLGLILGGAFGNLVDRIRFRAVVDFLDFHYAGWHWPAFNVADIAICTGAFLAALLLWKAEQPSAADNT